MRDLLSVKKEERWQDNGRERNASNVIKEEKKMMPWLMPRNEETKALQQIH
jgi:hypothetical protein